MTDNSLEMRKIMERVEQLDEIPGDPAPYVDIIQPHKNTFHPSDEFTRPKKRKSNVVPKSPNAQKAIALQDKLEDAVKFANEIEDVSEVPLEDRQELLKMVKAIQVKFA